MLGTEHKGTRPDGRVHNLPNKVSIIVTCERQGAYLQLRYAFGGNG